LCDHDRYLSVRWRALPELMIPVLPKNSPFDITGALIGSLVTEVEEISNSRGARRHQFFSFVAIA
jgi:hypothetical protein